MSVSTGNSHVLGADTSSDAPTVLIVEDDPFIAIDLEDAFRDADFNVLGPYISAEQALAALAQHDQAMPDIATLDYNIADGTSEPVAEALNEHDIPFLVLSSMTKELESVPSFSNSPTFQKPVHLDKVITKVLTLLG